MGEPTGGRSECPEDSPPRTMEVEREQKSLGAWEGQVTCSRQTQEEASVQWAAGENRNV